MALELERILRGLIKTNNTTEPDRQFLSDLHQKTVEYLHLQKDAVLLATIKDSTLSLENTHLSPSALMEIWQNIWNLWNHRQDTAIEVPLPDIGQDELNRELDNNRMFIYVPPELSKITDIKMLIEGYLGNEQAVENHFYSPGGDWGIKKIRMRNLVDQQGWLHTENSLKTPHIGDDLNMIQKSWEHMGLTGMTLNTYLICALVKDMQNKTIDEISGGITNPNYLTLLPNTVIISKNWSFPIYIATQNVTGSPSFHIRDFSTLEDYQRRNVGIRTVRPIKSSYQPRFQNM